MTIAQVSKRFDLSPDTLRYYERIGLIPPIARTPGGIRNYTEEDCKRIECIKCMRCAGLSIETIIEYNALFQQGEKTAQKRKALLSRQRKEILCRIERLQRNLNLLDKKIAWYEQSMESCKQIPCSKETTTRESPC